MGLFVFVVLCIWVRARFPGKTIALSVFDGSVVPRDANSIILMP